MRHTARITGELAVSGAFLYVLGTGGIACLRQHVEIVEPGIANLQQFAMAPIRGQLDNESRICNFKLELMCRRGLLILNAVRYAMALNLSAMSENAPAQIGKRVR